MSNQGQQQQLSLSQAAKENFLNACKSSATKTIYQKALDYFMDFIKLDKEDYQRLLEKDPKIIQDDIIRFIIYLRNKNKSFSTIQGYVSGLSKFLVMNDILTLNWKKIKSNFPDDEGVAEDRPYTHEEIKKLIDVSTTIRNKAIIYTLSSAGLRIGAIPSLRIKHLVPIDQYGIYRINVYWKSNKSRYFTFCSPEARNAIDSYLEWRKRFGERITENSPVFCIEYNAFGNYDERLTRKIKPCTENAITHLMDRYLRASGLRSVAIENQEHKRREIMRSHGLRKFFETNAFKAGMDHIYIRRIMGQKSNLEDSYLDIPESDLLEGDSKHVGYIGIVDQLTIDEENRLRREVQTLKIDKKNMEQVLERINALENKILNH